VPGKPIVSNESIPVTHGENPKLASLLAKAVCTVPITLNCSAVARIYNTEHLPNLRRNGCEGSGKKD